jgi:hypothetical protein
VSERGYLCQGRERRGQERRAFLENVSEGRRYSTRDDVLKSWRGSTRGSAMTVAERCFVFYPKEGTRRRGVKSDFPSVELFLSKGIGRGRTQLRVEVRLEGGEVIVVIGH